MTLPYKDHNAPAESISGKTQSKKPYVTVKIIIIIIILYRYLIFKNLFKRMFLGWIWAYSEVIRKFLLIKIAIKYDCNS